MISQADIAPVESTAASGRWYLHNGFDGWSYGCPVDPTPITRACALRILSVMIERRHPDAIARLAALPNALDYADEDDDLCRKTGNNRLIAYLNPTTCIFKKARKSEQDYDV
jgi:hypothetical protein